MFRSMLIAVLAATAVSAHAAAVVPKYDTFGNLPGATFGGSGIPTDPAAIDQGGGFTVALIANQRYANPALTNNGAGTYYATPGLNNGLDGVPHSLGTTWNFGYYINGGTAALSGFQIDLFYDFDPTVGNDLTSYGRIDIDAILAAQSSTATLVQDSQILNFAYLAAGIPGLVFAPGGTFDPNATGEYGFLLRVSNQAGLELASSAILVNVNSVPEPGSLALAGLALLGVFGSVRRKR